MSNFILLSSKRVCGQIYEIEAISKVLELQVLYIAGGWAIPGDDGEFVEKAYSVFLFAFMHNIPVGCLCFFYGSVIRKMVKMAADKQASENVSFLEDIRVCSQ